MRGKTKKKRIEWAPKSTIIRCVSYNDAKLYCDFLIVDGKSDWRLPTEPERLKRKAICWEAEDVDDCFGSGNYNWIVHAVRDL